MHIRIALAGLIFCTVVSATANGQVLIKGNEKLIFSFQNAQGKRAVLAKDSLDRYIVYRFGFSKQVEFQYPTVPDSSSWQLFKYSWYLRGGGKMNEGLDLNYVQFTNDQTKYVMYETYAASNEEKSIGIRIIPLNKGEALNMPGRIRSRKGSLIDLRNCALIAQSDEQFD
jgi:hypothetical protein